MSGAAGPVRGLHIEPHERLGIGGPDVEPPVPEVDRQPVQAGLFGVGVLTGKLLGDGFYDALRGASLRY